MNKKLWYLVAGYGLTIAFGIALQFLPPTIPVMRQTLNISPGQAGTLMSSLALFGIVVSPVVGYLADRWGAEPSACWDSHALLLLRHGLRCPRRMAVCCWPGLPWASALQRCQSWERRSLVRTSWAQGI